MVSFDVVFLFTSISVELALKITLEILQQEGTDISVARIMKLLELVLKSSHFTYEQDHYLQAFGYAMGLL